MKNFVVWMAGLFILAGCAREGAKNEFVLKGRVDGLKTGLLFLYHTDSAGARVKDSSALDKGKFMFTGKISEPSMAYLELKEEKRSELNSASFFLQPGNLKIDLVYNKFSEAVLRGSISQDEYAGLIRSKETVYQEMAPLQKEFQTANEQYIAAIRQKAADSILAVLKEQADAMHERFTPFNERLANMDYAFFASHPQSAVTAQMLQYHVSSLTLDSLQLFYDRLGEKLQQSATGKELGKQIEQLRGGSPGNPAKDFSTIDLNGDTLRLSDFRGKYVLLDFWASWCGPCRKGNPHLKEIYAKLRDKGIEFIGISDDDSRPDAWRKAVEKDGLPWRHVLRGFDMARRMKNLPIENDISDKFGIHTLPTKILIDPAGMIIGRYSEDEIPLDKKLAEVFGAF